MTTYQPQLFKVMEWDGDKFTCYLENGRDRVVWYFKGQDAVAKHDVIAYTGKRQNARMSATIYEDMGIDYLGATFTLDELINAINNPNHCFVPYYKEPEYIAKINKYEKRRKMMHSFIRRCRRLKLKLAYKYCKYTNEVIKWDGQVGTILKIKGE